MHLKCLLLMLCFLEYVRICDLSNLAPPPVSYFTTITLFTDLKTRNEAARICEDKGGKLLDITYYSLFNIILSFSFESPWKDLPIGNGPTAWIALHRRVTPLGDNFYSNDCQRLSDFQVAYWNTSSPYSVMAGDATSYCVYNRIYVSPVNGVSTAKHGYTRGRCDELHHFFCMSENGPCTFEEIDGYYGDSSNDYTDNDVIYAYESDDKCKQLCLNSFSEYFYTGLRVTEECWGFSSSASECRLHIIVKPTYFDKLPHRISSATRKLFIKRCFSSAVNYNTFDVAADNSVNPDSNCGTPTFVNISSTSLQVFVYQGVWTWNEAFTTCKQSGLKLLEINNQTDYLAVRQIVEKYVDIQRMDYLWTGLHEPDPFNHTDIRVWSDCGENKRYNWDPDSLPSSDVSDTSFCVLLDTSTNYWYTTKCNDQHYFICTGNYAGNHSFSNGIQFTIGLEVSIGPYKVSKESCRDMCSTLTYSSQECWGFAILETETDTLTECYIYFMDCSNTNVSTISEPSTEPFTLYTKLIWSDIPSTRSGESDSSLIPKSCCDVSGIMSECPDNNIPIHSESIPTTEKVEFVLFTETRTWNEALWSCNAVGGTLLQVDDVSKRAMLQRYVNTWIEEDNLSGDIWTGLSQLHSDDPCSLRWASDCSRPDWTDFVDLNYSEDINSFCTAITRDIKFVKRSCDQTLQFVCEIKTGTCDMFDVFFDINCTLGQYGSLLSVPFLTCLADCQYMINNGTECWAAVKTGPLSCNLMFYIDPDYCKENNVQKKGYDVFFRSCFSASIFGLRLLVSSDDNILPKTSCSDSIPTNLIDELCYITTKVTTANSTSSMSQSRSSTEYQSSTATEGVSSTTSNSPFTSSGSNAASHSLSTSEDVSSMSSDSPSTSSLPVTMSQSSFPQSSFTTAHESSTHSTIDPFVVGTTTIPPITTLSSSTESVTSVSSTQSNALTTNPLSTTSKPSTSSHFPSLSKLSQFTKPLFILPCLCYSYNKSKMTVNQWNEWYALSNTVAKQNTSRYRRKLTSVADHRTSSLSIGMVVSSVFIALALYTITTDIPRILSSAKYIHGIKLTKNRVSLKYKSL